VRTTWSQPFHWGLLVASDPAAPFDAPDLRADGTIQATASCLSVPVLHAQDVVTPPDWPDDEPVPEAMVEVTVVVDELLQDVDRPEFEGTLVCPSGRLLIGDADSEREVAVPVGTLRVRVTRDPVEFAERVHIHLVAAGSTPDATAGP
jgi:hypothetical protein